MKNKLRDLNDHLFAQIERLGADDLAGDALDLEVRRTSAMVNISGQIIDANKLALDARKAATIHGWDTTAGRPRSRWPPARPRPVPQHRGAIPWNKGTHGLMKPNSGSYRPGHVSWSAGTKGVMKRNAGPSAGPSTRAGRPTSRPARWDPKGSEWSEGLRALSLRRTPLRERQSGPAPDGGDRPVS